MDPTKIALIRQTQQELPECTDAFEQLAAHYYALVRQMGRRVLGNWDDADNVAQDVMIRVLGALPRLREIETFEGWLRQIVVNTAKTFISREIRNREKAELALASSIPSEDYTDISPASLPGHEAVSFNDLISPLSLEERTILTLRFVHDASLSQIATHTDQALSATKMRFYRALKKLEASSTLCAAVAA